MTYKAMYKYELAQQAGVSKETFRTWCHTYRKELADFGCSNKCQLLTPAAVRFLCEKFCIILE